MEADVQTFIFVRHGKYDKAGKSYTEQNKLPLNALGVEQIEHAADFLLNQGLIPDLVVSTRKERSAQSGQIIVERVCPQAPLRKVSGGFIKAQELDSKLEEWINDLTPPPKVVLFAGHCKTQEACLRGLGAPADVPKDNLKNGCVLVYSREKANAPWQLAAYQPTVTA